jgi:hypothetical protein
MHALVEGVTPALLSSSSVPTRRWLHVSFEKVAIALRERALRVAAKRSAPSASVIRW